MGMQIKATNGDSFILNLWTQEWDDKKDGFKEKQLHVKIENDHLFIVDNSWNSLSTKPYDYSWRERGRGADKLSKIKEKAIGSKAQEVDGICIDLNTSEECESIRTWRESVEKEEKVLANATA